MYHAPVARSLPPPTVWTPGRKWAGNLLPLLFWVIPTGFGLGRMVLRGEIETLGVWLVALGVVLGWVATNWFGALPNRAMRAQLERILKVKKEEIGDASWFVGFATPRYSSALDPHEDVGFLVLEPDRIRFVSESRSLEVARADARKAGYRTNVHTLVGLGRWVALDGEVSGRPVRLLLEPRTRPTMLGNLLASRSLLAAINAWLKPR